MRIVRYVFVLTVLLSIVDSANATSPCIRLMGGAISCKNKAMALESIAGSINDISLMKVSSLGAVSQMLGVAFEQAVDQGGETTFTATLSSGAFQKVVAHVYYLDMDVPNAHTFSFYLSPEGPCVTGSEFKSSLGADWKLRTQEQPYLASLVRSVAGQDLIVQLNPQFSENDKSCIEGIFLIHRTHH